MEQRSNNNGASACPAITIAATGDPAALPKLVILVAG
jgi:hypothetical protein